MPNVAWNNSIKCPSCKSQDFKNFCAGMAGYAGIGDFDNSIYWWKQHLLVCNKCNREWLEYEMVKAREI